MKLKTSSLKIYSLFYLAISHFLFYGIWLKPVLAFLFSSILLYGIFLFYKNAIEDDDLISLSKRDTVLLAFSLLSWVGLSGVGGFGMQTFDYAKNNALANEIINDALPITYTIGSKVYNLCHYLGYYLPPALLGRLTGWIGFNYIGVVWLTLGTGLAMLWIGRLVGKFSIYLWALFIFFGGLRLLGGLIMYGYDAQQLFHTLKESMMGRASLFPLNSLTYSFSYIYHNSTDLLYWSPQHTLGGWIAAGLLLYDWKFKKNVSFAPLYIALTMYWSPWTFAGLSPLFAVAFFQLGYKKNFNLQIVGISLIIFTLTFLYLKGVADNKLISHLIWNSPGDSAYDAVKAYFIFIIGEIIVFAWAIAYIQKKERLVNNFAPFVTAFVMLLLIPFYRYGMYNDWCAKASVVPLFVLFIGYAKSVFETRSRSMRSYLLVLAVLIGVIPAISIISSARHSRNFTYPNYPKKEELLSVIGTAEKYKYPKEQFISSSETFFFKYLAPSKLELPK